MKTGLRSLGLTTIAMVSLTLPAFAHPLHGFQASGPLHSLIHALDAAGLLFVGISLLIATAVTIKASLSRRCDRQA